MSNSNRNRSLATTLLIISFVVIIFVFDNLMIKDAITRDNNKNEERFNELENLIMDADQNSKSATNQITALREIILEMKAKKVDNDNDDNEIHFGENVIVVYNNGKTEGETILGPSFTPVDRPLPAEIQEYLWYVCADYHVDFYFMMGLIELESDFDIDNISPTNDYGLCQINVCNHSWLKKKFGITDFLDPYQNIICGVYMIADLFERYEDCNLVLMAYNMGEDNALRHWNAGTHENNYSRAVMKKVNALQEEYCVDNSTQY